MIAKTHIDMVEDSFHDKELLETEYLQKYRDNYEWSRSNGFYNPYRSYTAILNYFSSIRDYNQEHERSFAKRIKSDSNNWKGCEAIISEVIVYHYYIRLIGEGFVSKLELLKDEADIVVIRNNQTSMFLEVFCIMPDFPEVKDNEIKSFDSRTHTHDAFSSVRQKLLKKITKQKQMVQRRENIAIIEMNHPLIANDFSVAASLSDGYKIWYDRESMKQKSEGYDWSSSVFDLPQTKFLKAITWFHLGAYEYRKSILNPKFMLCSETS